MCVKINYCSARTFDGDDDDIIIILYYVGEQNKKDRKKVRAACSNESPGEK